MIIELIVRLLVGVVQLFSLMLGSLQPPAWLSGVSGQMSTLLGYGASMGAWVPWDVFGLAIAALGTCLAISFTLRIVRMAMSLFTGGGGSAA